MINNQFKDFIIVSIKNKKYVVINFKYNKYTTPIVMDLDFYEFIKTIDTKWYINNMGYVSCIIDNRFFTLHEIIMKYYYEDKFINKPIIHINKILLDNRLENIIFDIIDKNINKNNNKKKRTIVLPNTKINPDDIPTYIWYIKQTGNNTFDDRFMIKLDDFVYKSTSSSFLSTEYKLEETKKYMRYILNTYPNILKKFSMNGDLNESGINNFKSFIDIINNAKFNNTKYNIDDFLSNYSNTYKLLEENKSYLSSCEIYILNNFNPPNKLNHKLFYNKFFDDINSKLPKYTQYYPSTYLTGEYFTYKNKWKTSDNKNINLDEKYNSLINYIKSLK